MNKPFDKIDSVRLDLVTQLYLKNADVNDLKSLLEKTKKKNKSKDRNN